MKTILWIVIAIVGWMMVIYQNVESRRREQDIRNWTAAAFRAGMSEWKSAPEEVHASNQKFYEDAVLAAHRGAWH